MNPLTVRVLREIGIHTEGLRSKSVKDYIGVLPVRYLIVVCSSADRACPNNWPGVRERMLWRFEDPARSEDTDDDPLDRFREVRDHIEERITQWLAELAERQAVPSLVA